MNYQDTNINNIMISNLEKKIQENKNNDNYAPEYSLIKELGSGTYGKVFLGEDQFKNKVAIKKIKKLEGHDGIPASTLREISILKELDHPKIIKLFTLEIVDEGDYLVLFIII